MTDLKHDIPISIELNLDDPESIERAAEILGTTPEAVRNCITFSRNVVIMADEQDLTRGQLVTAVMSVLTLMVKECGDAKEQAQMCIRLLDGLWASLGLGETAPIPDGIIPKAGTQVH